jgi:hypothetical protein
MKEITMAAQTAAVTASHYGNIEYAQVGSSTETQTIPHHIAVETIEDGERGGRHAFPRRATDVTC